MFTDHVKHEADEPVMRRKWQQHFIHKDDMLEVVDDALAIEVVHGRAQKIPIQRLGEPQAPRPAWHVCDCNDLFEGYHLHPCYDKNDEYVAGEEGNEEGRYHDKGPYRPCDDGLLLLLVFGVLGFFLDLRGRRGVSFEYKPFKQDICA